jgi:ferric-dicitrate binding protein FerR (iron transport regulator)
MATSVGAAAAAAAARAQREMREHFEKQNAFDPEHAVAYEPTDRIHERQRDLLIGRGILRETGDGRYWIDREATRLDEERRRAAAILVVKIVVIATVIGIGVIAILSR